MSIVLLLKLPYEYSCIIEFYFNIPIIHIFFRTLIEVIIILHLKKKQINLHTSRGLKILALETM